MQKPEYICPICNKKVNDWDDGVMARSGKYHSGCWYQNYGFTTTDGTRVKGRLSMRKDTTAKAALKKAGVKLVTDSTVNRMTMKDGVEVTQEHGELVIYAHGKITKAQVEEILGHNLFVFYD